MGEYILAHWCYSSNFGDALNPYLLNKLSGKKVKYSNSFTPNYKEEIFHLVRSICHFHKNNLRLLLSPEKSKPVVLAVGSILSRSRTNYLVWGGGYMDALEKGRGGKFLAVRGPFSADKLVEEGYPRCTVYGDPALLLPLVYTPITKEKCKVGIIPHLRDLPHILRDFPNSKVINLGKKIEEVIDEINSCEYILSTSLHGIIVAHAYGIPALWIKRGYIFTDGLKFNDYFASVEIPLYDGSKYNLEDIVCKSFHELSSEIRSLMLPHKSVIELQRDLLRVAPFEVKQSILDKVQ